jgi:hypothetical protein
LQFCHVIYIILNLILIITTRGYSNERYFFMCQLLSLPHDIYSSNSNCILHRNNLLFIYPTMDSHFILKCYWYVLMLCLVLSERWLIVDKQHNFCHFKCIPFASATKTKTPRIKRNWTWWIMLKELMLLNSN